jgi:hypothetical protein
MAGDGERMMRATSDPWNIRQQPARLEIRRNIFSSRPNLLSLPRSAMMGAKRAGLLRRLINDQTLPNIMARMPLNE